MFFVGIYCDVTGHTPSPPTNQPTENETKLHFSAKQQQTTITAVAATTRTRTTSRVILIKMATIKIFVAALFSLLATVATLSHGFTVTPSIATSVSRNSYCYRTATDAADATVLFSGDGDEASRVTGTVKWFDKTKGFGFITPNDGGEDVFVHQTAIVSDGFRSLSDGAAVEFQVGVQDNGKTRAVDVTGPGGEKIVSEY